MFVNTGAYKVNKIIPIDTKRTPISLLVDAGSKTMSTTVAGKYTMHSRFIAGVTNAFVNRTNPAIAALDT